MRALVFSGLVVLAAAVVAGCVNPAAAPTGMSGSTPASRALHALFEAEWEHDLAESPVWASSIGDRRYDARWDDVSLAAQARRDLLT